MKKKVLFTATLVRGHIAKFHIPYLEWFQKRGWETWVAARNDYPDGVCQIPCCDRFVDVPFSRDPFSWENVRALSALTSLINEERFDLVHTHTPVGSVLTRIAARKARSEGTEVVYTAHGFHFFEGAPLINWLLWYPVEVVMSHYADVIVTINREDFLRARRFARCRVEYVPGVGVDIARFEGAVFPRGTADSFGVSEEDYVLLAVGDLIPRKNHAVIISALSLLPNDVKLVVCGSGPEESKLRSMAERLGVCDRVIFAGFRGDVEFLLALVDVFVFPSIHEGLPVSVLEAMASGTPVIASAIRGICPDLIEDGKTGILLEESTPENIALAVERLRRDEGFGRSIAAAARESVKRFDLSETVRAMSRVYGECGVQC